jgi:hypothetical protein
MKTKLLENLLLGTLALALAGCIGIKTQNITQSGPLDPKSSEGTPPLRAYLMNDTNLTSLIAPPEEPSAPEAEHKHGKEGK